MLQKMVMQWVDDGRGSMMDTGRDPGKDIFFPSLGLIVSWLLTVTKRITFHVFKSTARREFVVAQRE